MQAQIWESEFCPSPSPLSVLLEQHEAVADETSAATEQQHNGQATKMASNSAVMERNGLTSDKTSRIPKYSQQFLELPTLGSDLNNRPFRP